MIKINRGPVPPKIKIYSEKKFKGLNGSRITKAEQELEKAIAFFTNPANYQNDLKITTEKFSFGVYKNRELAKELERVFGKKCAYCESDFAHVMPREVEHFRPKNEIETRTGKLQPGYFWLAGEWTNLLVACVDCNRSRHHEVPGQPKEIRLGKATQFPLSDETFRLRAQAALTNEDNVRLLLDPCNDEPEDHLTFDEEGLVWPRRDAHGQPSKKGEASISVFALQRKKLVEKRRQVLIDLKSSIEQLGYLVKNHNKLKSLNATQSDLDENTDQIRKLMEKLAGMLRREAPFQAMLRGYIRDGTQRGDFENLKQFKIELTDLFK